jgi:DNA-binding protein YbaB
MTQQQQLKDAVLQAQQEFNAKVNDARDKGVIVNLWVAGNGPEIPSPSELQLNFGDAQ